MDWGTAIGVGGVAFSVLTYFLGERSGRKAAGQQNRNMEILAEYLIRHERGENVEIVRGEPGTGLKNLNVRIMMPEEVAIKENIAVVVKPEEKDPD